MKKLGSLLLVFLLVFSLVACNNADAPAKDAGETTGAGEAKEDVSVALLVAYEGDMSFNDSAIEGLKKAEEELGIKLNVIEFGNDPKNYEPTVIDAADQGYDLIMMPITLQDAVQNNADSYPDSTFVIFDGEVEWDAGEFDNVHCITYKANQAAFLGGYASAAVSETGILGFLGGLDLPVINDFLLGFIEGAQEYNPDIKVITTYSGTFSDPSKGKELTLGMINQGADVSFNVAGGTGVGLIEASAENGKYVLGVDSDQALVYEAQGKEDLAKSIFSSVLKNVGESLYRAVDLYQKGELKIGETEELGLAENGVGLADNKYFQEIVPAEVIEKVKEIEQKIINGEIEITSAMGKTTDEISEIRDAVKP